MAAPVKPLYLVTELASEAIQAAMRERGWVDGQGRIEWSKLVVTLRDKRKIRVSKQGVQQAVKNIGGRTEYLRDMLIALDLPSHLATPLDDVDRLLLTAAHDGGIRDLSPAEQREVAELVRRQVELMVRASGPRKK